MARTRAPPKPSVKPFSSPFRSSGSQFHENLVCRAAIHMDTPASPSFSLSRFSFPPLLRVLGPSTSALLALHAFRSAGDPEDAVPNRVHVHLTGGELGAPTAWCVTEASEAMVTGVVLRVVASSVDDAEVRGRP